MLFKIVFLFCIPTCILCISTETEDIYNIYNEFMQEIINHKKTAKKIQDSGIELPSDIWLKMIDASTKIPSGLLNGAYFDLGNYDECYNIQYQNIYGKYCLGKFMPPTEKYQKLLGNQTQLNFSQPRLMGLGTEYMGLHFARCVPSTIAAKDIGGLSTYSEDFCYSKATEPDLSTGAIITIVILSIFGIIVVVSTLFDLFLFYSDKKPPHELFIAFSFWTNGRKIFKSTQNSDQLLCLNGIKAISMLWVIIGHEYSLSTNAAVSNFWDLMNWRNDSANMFIIGGTVSVDTFFVVGGLVTIYTYLKSIDKGVKFNIFLYYIHRYLRLTPAFAIMSLVYLYILTYLGGGPLWKVIDLTLVKPCEKSWWSSMLYVSNYYQQGECLPQSWYLNVDMQLYILSPIILLPLIKWPKYTLGFMYFLTIAGCLIPFGVSYGENLSVWMGQNGDMVTMMYDLYKQTYARFGPYVIGMIAGYYLYKIKTKQLTIKLSKLIVYLLWLIFLTGLTACIWGGYPVTIGTEEDKWGNAFFNGFSRSAWGLCVAGIIFLCVAGYGTPIDKFLSLPVFQFLTKLSYSMYLVHYAVITVRLAGQKNVIKFSNLAWMHIFWADFAVTVFISLIVCLTFESPIIILEKYLFGKGVTPKRAENQTIKSQV